MNIHEKLHEIFKNAKTNKCNLWLSAPHHKTGYKGEWDYLIDGDLIAITIYEGGIGNKDVIVFYRIVDISLEIGKKDLTIVDVSAKQFNIYLKTLEDKRRYLRI